MNYTSLNDYLKTTYGYKLYKVSLNAGLTCPNRDGRAGFGGCIFCSEGGSGDFAGNPDLSISEQIEQQKALIQKKLKMNKSEELLPVPRYIAYFQAFTNTYGPMDYLRKIYLEAACHPDIAIISIATRPDCLGDDVMDLLKEINQIKPVWIELGLQTIHKESACFIRRGYSLDIYDHAVSLLNEAGIKVITHLIIGLPGETEEMMYDSVRYVAQKDSWGIKLQLLHILKNTPLAQLYQKDAFHILSLSEYTNIIVNCLKIIPESMVVHRITGDGPKSLLIEPKWSANKKLVLNTLNNAIRNA